jgi:hypothetical protein
MRIKTAFLFLIIVTGFLTSCNQALTVTTPAPTIEIINLQITPELEHWMPKVSRCANAIEGLGIYTDVVTQTELDISRTDLVLRLGERAESDPYVAVMGFEEFVLISGNAVPIDKISIDSVRAIFSGEITNWGEVPEVCDQDVDINQPIQTLSFPEGNILRELFSRSFLENKPIMSDPMIYATPEGLDRLLQENSYSIAYLLKSNLMESQDPMIICGIDPSFSQQFVLGITNIEPEGKLKQLLLCLQDPQ